MKSRLLCGGAIRAVGQTSYRVHRALDCQQERVEVAGEARMQGGVAPLGSAGVCEMGAAAARHEPLACVPTSACTGSQNGRCALHLHLHLPPLHIQRYLLSAQHCVTTDKVADSTHPGGDSGLKV